MRLKSEQGFSLLELLIVIGIIASIAVLMMPAVNLTKMSKLKTVSRELVVLMKASFDEAVQTGKIHRLVFDLKKKKIYSEFLSTDRFARVEFKTKKTSAFEIDAKKNFLEDVKVARSSAENEQIKVSQDDPALILDLVVSQADVLEDLEWLRADSKNLKPIDVSDKLVFYGIGSEYLSASLTYPIDENFFYIYFFPEGLATTSYIQLAFNSTPPIDSNQALTVILDGLSGRSRLERGAYVPKK